MSVRQRTLYLMEHRYRTLARTLPKNWNTYDNFLKVVRNLDRTSSPGYPLCREATTIGRWLYGDEFEPKPERLATLWLMVQDVLGKKSEHLYKVFVKAEPHTLTKRQEGRWRLIIASSLPWQVAWAMAVDHMSEAFLQHFGENPIKYAYVQFGGGWKRRNADVERHQRYWCADKSSWDWLSPGWVYEDIRELRKRLTRGATAEWEDLIDFLYADAYENSHLLLPDGRIMRQLAPGFMKSGLRVTIQDNSFGQDFFHVATCVTLNLRVFDGDIDICGDDTQQVLPERPEKYLEVLQSFGCMVKHAVLSNEFMGHRLDGKGFYPLYTGKHVYNLLHQKDEFLPETLDSYLRIYACWPEMWSFYARIAGRLGVEYRSYHYYRYFADNPEALEGMTLKLVNYIDPVVGPALVM